MNDDPFASNGLLYALSTGSYVGIKSFDFEKDRKEYKRYLALATAQAIMRKNYVS